jgi:hypothetical protein
LPIKRRFIFRVNLAKDFRVWSETYFERFVTETGEEIDNKEISGINKHSKETDTSMITQAQLDIPPIRH